MSWLSCPGVAKNTSARYLRSFPVKVYKNDSVLWASIRRLLNVDKNEKGVINKWINEEVVNIYFTKYLAELDQK